ncbi:MAG: hypothetical protein J3Q66DRAFT_386055 [Benniella sp.]|nr:MAG: hypothetical protein J3Q66DRAFT_386055 [Benniella sp.]
MKFLAVVAVAASSLVAIASACVNPLQIKSPAPASVWTAGKKITVSWSGDCKDMDEAGRNVTVDLVTGPASAVRFVTTLGQIDCAGSKNSTSFNLPRSIDSGYEYALIVRTVPEMSMSYNFAVKRR